MNPKRIFLIGYRCTGKSSVGRNLAYRLEWAFCDTDRLIEQYADRTIREIFDSDGEETFRDLEQEILKRCSSTPEAVVAAGGGAVLREENRRTMSENGTVIWLRAQADTIRERMESDEKTDDDRPALSGSSAVEEVNEVLDERRPTYDETADYSISTDDHPPSDIAGFILDEIQEKDG